MTPYETKILKLLVHSPELLFPLLKSQRNVPFAYSILKKYLPQDIGLEIEGVGEARAEMRRRTYGWKKITETFQWWSILKETYGFNNQFGIHCHIDATEWFHKIDKEGWKETLVYSKNGSLYHHCTISTPKMFDSWILPYLLDEVFMYQGEYNARVITCGKTAIRCHSLYRTIEYRVLPMCETWQQLIKYILVCQYTTNMFKNKLALTNERKDTIQQILAL